MARTGLVAATLAAVGLVPAIAHADPGGGSAANNPANPANPAEPAPDGPDAVKQQVAGVAALYQQAEASTQQYDATEERIARLQSAVAGSASRSAQLHDRLAAVAGNLGRFAAEQYRDAGLSPAMALLFSANPESYLERAGLTSRVAIVDRQRVVAVLSARQALSTLDRESAAELADLHVAEVQLAQHRADIESQLTAARTRLNSLDAVDRSVVTAALARGDDGDGFGAVIPASAPSLSSLLSAITNAVASAATGTATNAATAGLGGGVAGNDAFTPPDASRAVKAVEAAYNELGKPYVWGATGPDDFDCSGLTQHVWASAGVQLPRTSQEQADAGESVPVSAIRPGDLVVYFSGRSHIGIYVGRGLVIHSPRPGSVVQFTPLDSMPIDKVVRPVS
ncbi:MAG TPA: C40 family peptidase [Actinocrinis sp.]|uniref:C40 family peptidase n=1 Tax=Actinocrinis sp. TaxID=1920516 RepID=UPI002DDD130C|nr:C40 family peptidase [Actinocrinis sp.]HEV2342882.1 C40 family peptidase [Actinocrinis sp.]